MRISWNTLYLLEPLPNFDRLEMAALLLAKRARPVDVDAGQHRSTGLVYGDLCELFGDELDLNRVFKGAFVEFAVRFQWITVPNRLVQEEARRRIAALQETRGEEAVSRDEEDAISEDVRTILRKRALPEYEDVRIVIDVPASRVYLRGCPRSRVDGVVEVLESLGCKMKSRTVEALVSLRDREGPPDTALAQDYLSAAGISTDDLGSALLEWLFWTIARNYTSSMSTGYEWFELPNTAQLVAPEGAEKVRIALVDGVQLAHPLGGKVSVRDGDPAASPEVRSARRLGKKIVQARLSLLWEPPGDNVEPREFFFTLKAKGLVVSGVELPDMMEEHEGVDPTCIDMFLAERVALMAELDALVAALVQTYLSRRISDDWLSVYTEMREWSEEGGPWAKPPEGDGAPCVPQTAVAAARKAMLDAAGPLGTVTVSVNGGPEVVLK